MLIWLARIGVYLGLFVGVGGVFFAAWIGQGPSGSTVIRGALAIGLVSAVASLGLQGLDLLNLPLGGIVTSAPWTSALATSLGPSLLIAIVAMAIALVRVAKPEHADRLGADHARDGGRRAVAGDQRARRDRLAAMADRGRRCSCTASPSPSGSARWRRWRRWRGGATTTLPRVLKQFSAHRGAGGRRCWC